MGGVWGGGSPPSKGVRNALDGAADRAVSSRGSRAVYLTSQLVTGAVCELVLWVGRRLHR